MEDIVTPYGVRDRGDSSSKLSNYSSMSRVRKTPVFNANGTSKTFKLTPDNLLIAFPPPADEYIEI